MDNDRYEKAYRDAREALRLRGKNVGQPAFGQDNVRLTLVEGLLLPDREVFIEAWSEKLADEIVREQAIMNNNQYNQVGCVSQTDEVVSSCVECERLFRVYSGRSQEYSERRRHRETGAAGVESEKFVEELSRVRNEAFQALIEHATIHSTLGSAATAR